MIRGAFNRRRPHISGLVLFHELQDRQVSARFLVDTGADRSLLAASDYELGGLAYRDFAGYPPANSTGYGGGIVGKIVAVKLLLRHADGRYQQIGLEIEVVRRSARNEGLPSILGRDVTDLFRLTIDRSVNLVELDLAAAPGSFDSWPYERD